MVVHIIADYLRDRELFCATTEGVINRNIGTDVPQESVTWTDVVESGIRRLVEDLDAGGY